MFGCYFFFFFKQKTADKIRISDGSSDVCSSDLPSDGDSLCLREIRRARGLKRRPFFGPSVWSDRGRVRDSGRYSRRGRIEDAKRLSVRLYTRHCECARVVRRAVLCCRSRSEEHTCELQSLMRISYADFCMKKRHKYHTIRSTCRTNSPETQ